MLLRAWVASSCSRTTDESVRANELLVIHCTAIATAARTRSAQCGPELFLRLVSMVLLACLLSVLSAGASVAQDADALEKAVKATYLYKFAPFIDWPDPAAEFPAGSFTICVVGDHPFAGVLDRAVEGQKVAGRPIAVQHLPALSGNFACSLVYLGNDDAQFVTAALASLRGKPVLTVTDGQTDPANAGIINFVLQDNRVRFAIDDAAAAANHLTISSKLLSLATRVTGRNQPQ